MERLHPYKTIMRPSSYARHLQTTHGGTIYTRWGSQVEGTELVYWRNRYYITSPRTPWSQYSVIMEQYSVTKEQWDIMKHFLGIHYLQWGNGISKRMFHDISVS